MQRRLEDINSVIFQAPGKIIISGEYSSIFNKKIITTSVNSFTECSISLNNKFEVYSNLFKNKKQLEENFRNFFKILNHKIPKISVSINSNISINRGLGSSAAFINSFLFNYLEFILKKEIKIEEIFNLAKEIESIFHGKSSGIDIISSAIGGCISIDNLNENPFNYKKLNLNLNEENDLVVIDTGKKNDTRKTVSNVLEKFNQKDKIWEDFNQIANKIELAILDNGNFSDLIYENYKLLKYINVIPSDVCNFIAELKKNKCNAKISGSGGSFNSKNGGICIAFGNKEIIKEISEKFNYKILNLNPTKEGIKRKEISISCPGKLVLFGEHAVLHNKNSISVAINRRLEVKISKNWFNKRQIESLVNKEKNSYNNEDLKSKRKFKLLREILKNLNIKTGYKINIKSEIESGLGSSGALISSIISIFQKYLEFNKTTINKSKLFKKCMQFNKNIKHFKNSSGIDIASSIFGNIISYRKNKIPKIISNEELKIFAVYTKCKTNIDSVIRAINKKITTKKQNIIYNKIDSIVKKAIKYIENKDFLSLDNLIIENQKELENLKIMNKNCIATAKKLEELKIRDYKISGSGMGDYIITLNNLAKNISLNLKSDEGIKYEK